MKRLLFILALEISLCTYGQLKPLQQFDSAMQRPVWIFNQTYNLPYLDFLHGSAFTDGYMYDSVFVVIAPNQWVPDYNSVRANIIVTMSANTSKILWYVESVPQIDKVIMSKYGIICIMPGGIQCYDMLTGETRWRHSSKDSIVNTSQSPFTVYHKDSLLYVYCHPVGFSKDSTSFFIINERTGNIIKSYPGWLPEGANEILYVYNNYAILYNGQGPVCFDLQTDREVWTMGVKTDDWDKNPQTYYYSQVTDMHFRSDTIYYVEEKHRKVGRTITLNMAQISTGKKIEDINLPPSANDEFTNRHNLYRLDKNFIYLFVGKTPEYDYDTLAEHELHVRKLSAHNLMEIWDKGTGLTYSEKYYRPYAYNKETDTGSIYAFYNKQLAVLSKRDTSVHIKITTDVLDAYTIKQNSGYLFVVSGDYDKDDNYKVFSKTDITEKPLSDVKMHLLYIDYKANILYLTYHDKMIKVQLPK